MTRPMSECSSDTGGGLRSLIIAIIDRQIGDGIPGVKEAAVEILALFPDDAQAAPEPLTWLAEHKNYELSFNGWDDDPAWQVHSVNGGRNDREWTLIATGMTPSEALRKAMAAYAK